MIALLDTDVLIDVALDRVPFAGYSSDVLDAAQQRSFEGYMAWHTIANLFYVTRPVKKSLPARDFIRDLLGIVKIAPTTTKHALRATTLKIADLEDAPASGRCRML